MGFKRGLVKLTFKDGELEGLEVYLRRMAMDPFLELAQMNMSSGDALTAEDAVTLTEMRERIAGVLVSWNLEDESDVPVPATPEGMRAQDFAFVGAITAAYIEAISGVSGPLVPSSTNGESFPVDSIPMETRSPSPES